VPTILVVDDSKIARHVAGGVAEKSLDADVIYAVNGKEAIAKIEEHSPDLVVTDLVMPEMDGLQLVATIKDDFSGIPVILMTDKGNEDIAAEALRLGAASYVPKKRLEEDLPETLQRVLVSARESNRTSRVMHCMSNDESSYVLYNDYSLIQSLVSHIQQLLRCLPLGDETERLRVGLAVEEGLKNAYFHGNLEIASIAEDWEPEELLQAVRQRGLEPPYRDRRIHVYVRINRDEATFRIRDEGDGFDAATVLSTLEIAGLDETATRGIILMRSIMDEVSYNESGNELTLVKRRAPETIEDHSFDDDDS
jgi:CheY-like chemotaxis protein